MAASAAARPADSPTDAVTGMVTPGQRRRAGEQRGEIGGFRVDDGPAGDGGELVVAEAAAAAESGHRGPVSSTFADATGQGYVMIMNTGCSFLWADGGSIRPEGNRHRAAGFEGRTRGSWRDGAGHFRRSGTLLWSAAAIRAVMICL